MHLQRPPLSATQIAALPPIGTAEREAFVRSNGGTFEPETLVYLLREQIQHSHTALFNHLGRLLIGQSDGNSFARGHCEPIIRSVATSYGLQRDTDRFDEYRAEVFAVMWRAINDLSGAKHFWEERFGLALKGACIDVGRSLYRKRRRALREECDLDDVDLGTVLSDEGRSCEEAIRGIDDERRMEIIRSLPDRQAAAVLLAWVEDRPISGASTDSVTAVLGISATAVHNLLAKAKKKLAAHPTIRELLEDA